MEDDRLTTLLVNHYQDTGLADVRFGIDHTSPFAVFLYGEARLDSYNQGVQESQEDTPNPSVSQ